DVNVLVVISRPFSPRHRRHPDHRTVSLTIKAPPRTPGRGLRHTASTAPTMTPTSSSSVAANTYGSKAEPEG
ncbi:MAG: hypothetical protein U0990_05055, partial [Candidatus Nanopelagicales bacterium]|nr:hypothetical protein [Candidatus Nanopelagicales bacterium]